MGSVSKSGHSLYTVSCPPQYLKPGQPCAQAYSGVLFDGLESHPRRSTHVTRRGFPSGFAFSRILLRSPSQVTPRSASAMLPRNLLSTAARSAARRRLQVAPSRISRIPALSSHPTNNALSIGAAAQFHSSARRHNELPKSPFQTFVDVLKDELRKNREFAENVKQLQGDVDKFQDSEAMKKAKDAYERARVCPCPPIL